MKTILVSILIFACLPAMAQVAINTTGALPNSNAMLDVSSNTKGILIPRMSSANRAAISNPKTGLMVFDSTTASFWFYQTNAWREISTGSTSSDSSFIYGQTTGTVGTYNMTNGATYTSLSGYLYDSGGPAGNYGNNENSTITIAPSYDPSATGLIRIQLLSNNLENPYDSLFITDGTNNYGFTGTQTANFNLVLNPTLQVRFRSNNVNTAPGFRVRWDVILLPAPAADAPPSSGWYFIPQKTAVAGGVNVANNWSKDTVGLYSFSWGYGNKVKGFGSMSIGLLNSSGDNFTTTFGRSNSALASGAAALNSFNTASGTNALAVGNTTTASGIQSFASGGGSIASGDGSFAAGSGTVASNYNAVAFGYENTATGSESAVFGFQSQANGSSSFATGVGTHANGDYSFAAGGNATTGGESSFAGGSGVKATANYATAFGTGSLASGIASFAAGSYTKASLDYASAFGNATTAAGLSSFSAGKQSIATGDYSFAAGNKDTADGSGSFSMGQYSRTYGNNSVAIGETARTYGRASASLGGATIAGGNYSISTGLLSNASGDNSFAANYQTLASGFASSAFGVVTRATGDQSFTAGNDTHAGGNYSSAFGLNTVAKGYATTTMGMYNDSLLLADQTIVTPTAPIMVVGNGNSATNRSNALVILKNGNTGIGNITPQQNLSVATGMNIDQASANNGTISNTLTFGGGSGEGIGSKRTAGGNNNGLDLYTANASRISVNNNGNVGIGVSIASQKLEVNGNAAVDGNLTVGASNFGIIRNSNAVQMKFVTTAVTVNPGGGIAAGGTVSIPVTFSQTFSSPPMVYVGNCGGSGGWAEAVMTIYGSSNTGCTLYIFNPKGAAVAPNYTVNIIAIGTP